MGLGYLTFRVLITNLRQEVKQEHINCASLRHNYELLQKELQELRYTLTQSHHHILEMQLEVHIIHKKLKVVESALKEWVINYPPDKEHIHKMLRLLDDHS